MIDQYNRIVQLDIMNVDKKYRYSVCTYIDIYMWTYICGHSD